MVLPLRFMSKLWGNYVGVFCMPLKHKGVSAQAEGPVGANYSS